MYEAATCRIHLCDDDPYEELLHNVDEVETLLQDPVVLAATHRLLDPDADLDELRVNVLQLETISPEERALPRFSRRALKRLPTWDLWHKNELEQLDQMKALGMFGSPIKLPEGGILMRFHWQCQIKFNGKCRSRLFCDGSPRAAPEVHSTTNAYASCLEHPVFRLFIALCASDNLTICGGDAKDTFAHSPGPSMPTFMKLDDAFRDWHLERTGALLDKDLVLPVLRTLQGIRKRHDCGRNTSVRSSRKWDSRTQRTRRTCTQASFVARKFYWCVKSTISPLDVVKNPRPRVSTAK